MSHTRRRWIANLVAVAAASAAYLLLRFPPETSSFYPRCPVFTWLHVYCPGCGGTRALAALLHGRLDRRHALECTCRPAASFCRPLFCRQLLARHPEEGIPLAARSRTLRSRLLLVGIVYFHCVEKSSGKIERGRQMASPRTRRLKTRLRIIDAAFRKLAHHPDHCHGWFASGSLSLHLCLKRSLCKPERRDSGT